MAPTTPQQAGALSDELIDGLIEPILRAAGSSLRHYSMLKSREDIRVEDLRLILETHMIGEVPPSTDTDEAEALRAFDQSVKDRYMHECGSYTAGYIDCLCAHRDAAPPASTGADAQIPLTWMTKARELYSSCKLWPEESDEGLMALLRLRNLVAELLAANVQDPVVPWMNRTVLDIAQEAGIEGEPLARLAHIIADPKLELFKKLTTPICDMRAAPAQPAVVPVAVRQADVMEECAQVCEAYSKEIDAANKRRTHVVAAAMQGALTCAFNIRQLAASAPAAPEEKDQS